VPDGPGLGIVLDMEAVERHTGERFGLEGGARPA